MQKLLLFDDASQVSAQMSAKTASLFPGRSIDSFIGVDNFNIIAFDWYNARGDKKTSKIAIYMDEEDIFVFCESNEALEMLSKIIEEETKAEPLDNEQLLYHFFIRLLKNDAALLGEYELKIAETEDSLVSESENTSLGTITDYRKELLQLKKYYEQLSIIFDELTANENGLLSDKGVRFCTILGNRTDRLFSSTVDLRDYISQVLDVYQSQLDYKQNNLMKVFTVVTTIFLPLTLLVGWYGMNFKMPEFESDYGYPIVIGVSVAIIASLLIFFRRKKLL